MNQHPGAKVDLLRSWKASLRLEKVKDKAEAAVARGGVSEAYIRAGSGAVESGEGEVQGGEEGKAESTDGAESTEFIPVSELSSEASVAESAPAPASDSSRTSLETPDSSASNRSSFWEEDAKDAIVMRAGIAALRARVVTTLSTITH